MSHNQKVPGTALAAGVMGANALMFARVLIVTAALAPQLAARLWPTFIAPTLIGVALFWIGLRQPGTDSQERHEDKNPLQVWSALQMAAVFQIVLFAVTFATQKFGSTGLISSAVLLGVADVDALTLSMSRATSSGNAIVESAAIALVVGILTNTIAKCGLALTIGRGGYRTRTAIGLAAMAILLGLSLYLPTLAAVRD